MFFSVSNAYKKCYVRLSKSLICRVGLEYETAGARKKGGGLSTCQAKHGKAPICR